MSGTRKLRDLVEDESKRNQSDIINSCLLEDILIELRISNVYRSMAAGETITEEDLP